MAPSFLSRGAMLAFAWWAATGCCLLGTVLPPGNRPVRGPGSMHQPTRYDSNYNAYKIQEGYSMEGYRQFDSALWSHLSGLRTGMLYGSVTVPIMATPAPVGPVVVERSSSCILWICWDDPTPRRFRKARLASIGSVDARITSVLFGIYSRRTIVMRGSVSAPPPTPAPVGVEAEPGEQPADQPVAEPDAQAPAPAQPPAKAAEPAPNPDGPGKQAEPPAKQPEPAPAPPARIPE